LQASFHKKSLKFIAKIFSSGIVLFEKRKKSTNEQQSIKQKVKLFSAVCCSKLYFPSGTICYPNELFWKKKAQFLLALLGGKNGIHNIFSRDMYKKSRCKTVFLVCFEAE
jgi:hypothetical protein